MGQTYAAEERGARKEALGTHISLIPSLARSLLQRRSGDSLGNLGENGGSWRALPLIGTRSLEKIKSGG
jgi:hypothetical protein